MNSFPTTNFYVRKKCLCKDELFFFFCLFCLESQWPFFVCHVCVLVFEKSACGMLTYFG